MTKLGSRFGIKNGQQNRRNQFLNFRFWLIFLQDIHIDLAALNRRAATLKTKRCVKKAYQAAWLLRACTCIDLTTLAGDDTDSNVQRLCFKVRLFLKFCLKFWTRFWWFLGCSPYSPWLDQAVGNAGLQHHHWRRLRLPQPGQERCQVAQGGWCRSTCGISCYRFPCRSNTTSSSTWGDPRGCRRRCPWDRYCHQSNICKFHLHWNIKKWLLF